MGLVDSIVEGTRESGRIRAAGFRNQAQTYGNLFSNIAQTIGSIPAQIQQREQTAQQNELNTLRLQEGRGELADKEKARQKQAAVENVLSQHPNIEDALPELYKIDPRMAGDIAKHVSDAKKDADQERQRQEGYIASKLGGANDQGTWTKTLYTLKRAYPANDWSEFPDDFSAAKPFIAARLRGAMSPKEQSDADFKTADDARQAKTADETARHNAAVEAVTATNTLTDNERAQKVAEETARHNKAMEGLSARRAAAAGAQNAPLDLSPAGLDIAALNYKKTGTLPPLGMGDRTTRKIIINRAAALTPDDIARIESGGGDIAANKANYGADAGSLKKLQASRDAIGAFEKTAQKNIDIFLDTAGKVVDTGSPLANTAARYVTGKMLGSPNQAQYDAARQVAINEIAKITSNPNMSGQLSDSARHEVEAFNPNNATLKQTVAVMRLLKRDMANRTGSLDDQIAAIKSRIGNKPDAQTDQPREIWDRVKGDFVSNPNYKPK